MAFVLHIYTHTFQKFSIGVCSIVHFSGGSRRWTTLIRSLSQWLQHRLSSVIGLRDARAIIISCVIARARRDLERTARLHHHDKIHWPHLINNRLRAQPRAHGVPRLRGNPKPPPSLCIAHPIRIAIPHRQRLVMCCACVYIYIYICCSHSASTTSVRRRGCFAPNHHIY